MIGDQGSEMDGSLIIAVESNPRSIDIGHSDDQPLRSEIVNEIPLWSMPDDLRRVFVLEQLISVSVFIAFVFGVQINNIFIRFILSRTSESHSCYEEVRFVSSIGVEHPYVIFEYLIRSRVAKFRSRTCCC